jgi:hexokinase
VTLQGEGKFEMTQAKYRLTEEQKHGDGQALFDFCAECLQAFIEANYTDEDGKSTLAEGQTLPLGFTVRLLSISPGSFLMV